MTQQTSSNRPLRRVQAARYVTDKYNIPCSPKTLAKFACCIGWRANSRSTSQKIWMSGAARVSVQSDVQLPIRQSNYESNRPGT